MTSALAHPLPPAASSPSSRAGGKSPAVVPISTTAGASFDDLARSILAADAAHDTAAALDTVLAAGDREIARLTSEIDEAQTIATDIMSAADDAASAEQRAVSLGLARRRARSAVSQLESRLTTWNRADTERRANAERAAIVARHKAAVAAIEARWPVIAEEAVGLFAELVAAHREADRARVPVDGAVAGKLGIVGAMGNLGIVHLPKIDGGTHWPVEQTTVQRRAFMDMLR